MSPLLQQALKRPPSDRDLESFVKQHFGERAHQLARKGHNAPNKPTFFADEELVVTAFMCAFLFQREITVLTRDPDVLDNFIRLHYVLHMQYLSMLLADSFREQPDAFRQTRLRHPALDTIFPGPENLLIRPHAPCVMPALPQDYQHVPLYCWFLSGPDDNLRLCQTICECEMGQLQLLRVKGQTGGLNSAVLDGKNCHFELSPIGIPRPWSAIATDKRIQRQGASIPFFDIQLAWAPESF